MGAQARDGVAHRVCVCVCTDHHRGLKRRCDQLSQPDSVPGSDSSCVRLAQADGGVHLRLDQSKAGFSTCPQNPTLGDLNKHLRSTAGSNTGGVSVCRTVRVCVFTFPCCVCVLQSLPKAQSDIMPVPSYLTVYPGAA